MSVTLILVIVTSILTLYAWNNQQIQSKWMFNPYTVNRNREYHRFLTSGFIHGSWLHLIFNMFVLYMFGKNIEYVFQYIFGDLGLVLYVFMYLAAIVVSEIPTYLKNKDNPGYNSLGASGGTAAILFSYILFDPTQSLCLYGLLCFPGVMWGALYIVYSVYMGKKQKDNINHDAHLWGGLFGIGFTILVYPNVVITFFQQLTELSIF